MGIEYRKLGRTGLQVSEIGLGTEYLNQQPRRIVTSVVQHAIEQGVNYFMFPIHMAANAVPGKKDLLQACVSAQVGVVAMKPFAGGKLLREERSIRVARHQMGGGALLKLKKPASITAVQCLSYVLSQVGVTTAVPGCANLKQLEQVLAYGQATEEEKDFGSILSDLQQYETGECVYCNHCLPCPSAIGVGQVIRLVEMAQRHKTREVRAAYGALEAKASDCTKCGACKERCPFGVDVTAKMEQAVAVFG